VTTAVHKFGSVDFVMLLGHGVNTGASLSFTVTVNEQLTGGIPTDAVHVTVVTPLANVDPDAGLHVTVPQEPDTVGCEYVTTAVQTPGSVDVVMFALQVSAHSGFTVTRNEQVLIFPDESVAVHVTVVVPTAKLDPEGGAQLAVGAGVQLSVGVGVV
jgi:hypothetical protein